MFRFDPSADCRAQFQHRKKWEIMLYDNLVKERNRELKASRRRLLITKIDILRVAHCVRGRKWIKGSFVFGMLGWAFFVSMTSHSILFFCVSRWKNFAQQEHVIFHKHINFKKKRLELVKSMFASQSSLFDWICWPAMPFHAMRTEKPSRLNVKLKGRKHIWSSYYGWLLCCFNGWPMLDFYSSYFHRRDKFVCCSRDHFSHSPSRRDINAKSNILNLFGWK